VVALARGGRGRGHGHGHGWKTDRLVRHGLVSNRAYAMTVDQPRLLASRLRVELERDDRSIALGEQRTGVDGHAGRGERGERAQERLGAWLAAVARDGVVR